MKRLLVCSLVIYYTVSWSQPVWYCSRNKQEPKISTIEPEENRFYIASLNATSADGISISINDLIDIYSGVPVHVGGLPLSACFMPDDHGLTSAALTSLGLQPSAIKALARKSSIIQSNLYFVGTEKQMPECIAQHFPAVGYLSEQVNATNIQPCF